LDLQALAALCAPAKLLLLGEDTGLDVAQRSYRAAGNAGAVEFERAQEGGPESRIAEWLGQP
jgi:hypothetical protein